MLIGEPKTYSVLIARDLLQSMEIDDEAWSFRSLIRRRNARVPNDTLWRRDRTKAKMSKSNLKTILIVFFDVKSLTYKELLEDED